MAFNTGNDSDDRIVSEINMTPLIDVMLVLLIIFMVTSSVAVTSGLDIVLPQTTKTLKNLSSESVKIEIAQNGDTSLMGKVIKFENLKQELKIVLESSESKVVLVQGDKNANVGRMIEIMDMAKEAGAKRFAIAASSK